MLAIEKDVAIPLTLSINETLKAMEVGDSVSLVTPETHSYLMQRRVKAAAKKLEGRKFKIGNIESAGVGCDCRCWRIQ